MHGDKPVVQSGETGAVWFFQHGGNEAGPFSEEQMLTFFRLGSFGVDDWIWRAGWSEWRSASYFSENRAQPPPFERAGTAGTTVALNREQRAAVANAVYEHLMEENGVPSRDRQQSQFAQVSLQLITSFLLQAERANLDDATLIAQVEKAVHFAYRTLGAFANDQMNSEGSKNGFEHFKIAWRHREITTAFRDGFESREAVWVDRERLISEAANYLRQDLRSALLEWMLVDAIIASEVYSFGEKIKRNPSLFQKPPLLISFFLEYEEDKTYQTAKGRIDELGWLRIKQLLKLKLWVCGLAFVAPLAIAILAGNKNYTFLAAIFGGIAFIAATIWTIGILRRFFKRILNWVRPNKTGLETAGELYDRLTSTYAELAGGIAASPRRIREVLAKAADNGAAWNPTVFAILDDAIGRSTGRWH